MNKGNSCPGAETLVLKKIKAPELGVGIIYFSGFESVVESNSDLIDVLEIEPQTFWYKSKSEADSFSFDKTTAQYLRQQGKPILFHGVGFPVGGSVPPDPVHIPCLKAMMKELNPVWLSEHLSFNTVLLDNGYCNTNFLLPPLQTTEGIETACTSIAGYASRFPLPFAFETGVNYLSPMEFEIPDGKFVNSIAEKSGAHILLDLHNLLANQKNGRQKVADFIDQIDPQKVIQIHLAGGFYYDSYYLDAHSNVSGSEVLELFERVVLGLPALKAVTFEMLPDFLSFVPAKAIRVQLENMHRIWDKRGRSCKATPQSKAAQARSASVPSVHEWENTLGKMAIRYEVPRESTLANELEADKGLAIIRLLIEQFRRSLLVGSLKLTCRYLMLKYGMDFFNNVLGKYWAQSPPGLFASDNGLRFADFLLQPGPNALCSQDLLLKDLVRYEYHSLLTILDQQERQLQLSFDPRMMVEALGKAQLPDDQGEKCYITTITPSGGDMDSLHTVFHS